MRERRLRSMPAVLATLALLALLVPSAAAADVGDDRSAIANAEPSTQSDRARGMITFYFGLRRPEPWARAAFMAVGDPRSASYRRFASLDDVADRYGATPHTRNRFRRIIRRHGLRPRIHPSGVFARVRGPVRRFERAFRVRIQASFNDDVSANSYFLGGNRRLRLPKRLRPLVREVVTSYARTARPPVGPRAAPDAASSGSPADRSAGPRPGNAGTWADGCDDARATGAYSFEQVRSAYGLDAVGRGGGAAVAIVNAGEGVVPADIAEAARCFGLPELDDRTLLTDGQARPFGRGLFEPQEDLALVRGMAPGLRRAIFTQVWLDPELWFLGAARVLALPNPPDSLSISYGECERDIMGRRAGRSSRSGARLLDSLLVRLGLVGVGSFASAGDFGSTCNGQPFSGVTWPASSRYLTAAGGTRLVLDAANERVDEVVWNDLPWLSVGDGGGAGGGGLAPSSARPPYQRAIPVPGTARAVPDVSAHASMLPGWPVVMAGNWVEDGGTSASAPLLAGAFAALSARERAAGRPPLGPVNGLLYHLSSSDPDALYDVVSGDNGYLPSVPPRTAAPGYDLASGLGVPHFDRLAEALPPPAP